MSDAGKRRPEAADIPAVLDAVAEGASLRKACQELGIHPGHTHAFIDDDEDLRAQYARARELRAEVLAEQALSIGLAAATGQQVNGRSIKADGARVALDAIKWATARMAPKSAPVQKIDLTSRTRQMTDEEIAAEIAAFEGR